jgi:peptidoglycan/xylan/chitin deacetylase (PgdA/CDA1 family)
LNVTWKRTLSRGISEIGAVAERFRGRRLGFRILLYHAVGTRLVHDTYGTSIRPELFGQQMAILSGEQHLSVVGLMDSRADSVPLKVAITFDDGYKDNLYTAAPVLMKQGFPFTVFVTSSFLKSGGSDYLTPTELRELAWLSGAEVGSHGVSHVPLTRCDDESLWRELSVSRREIEDVIGKPVTAVAYPHGSVDPRVRDAAAQAGYTVGVCSRFDVNSPERDRLLLCRTEIVAGDTERVFRQKLAGAWDWRRWRSADPALAI